MNKYNPKIHHRKSIRLKGYNYSRAGLYFITVCVQNQLCLNGKIENGIMKLNDAGKMIEKWYYELGNKYPDKKCHEMVVMPNHFHCIIENAPLDVHVTSTDAHVTSTDAHVTSTDAHVTSTDAHVTSTDAHVTSTDAHVTSTDAHVTSTDAHVTSTDAHVTSTDAHVTSTDAHVGTSLRGRPSIYGIDNKKYNATIGDAMDWFKTMTTNEYIRNVKNNNWQRFYKKLWQRNYWEHIIRNDQSYNRISEYIINNPKNWKNDKFY